MARFHRKGALQEVESLEELSSSPKGASILELVTLRDGLSRS